jgi:hypothetical protein
MRKGPAIIKETLSHTELSRAAELPDLRTRVSNLHTDLVHHRLQSTAA